jgi:hypothetical protein
MLKRFRLINVEGVGRLVTSEGTFNLEDITDDVASRLHARGSRYIEEITPPAPAPEPAEAPAPKRRGKSSPANPSTP